MKKLCFLAAVLLSTGPASGQDLAITNARILDGRGGVIDRGSIVVRSGKIVSVGREAPEIGNVRVIDAKGRTVLPGFIDSHRHLIRGDAARWLQDEAGPRMQEFLDAGFTTVLSAGEALDPILELKRRIDTGRIKGPRLIVLGRVALAGTPGGAAPGAGPGRGAAGAGRGGIDPARSDRSRAPRTAAAPAIPPDQTRAAVAALAKAGVDGIKTNMLATPGGPEIETLKLVVSEGRKHNLPVVTHAVTVDDTLAAVAGGTTVLAHTPHIGRLEENPAAVEKIAKAGIPMMSTLGVFVPHFDDGNQPLFRDRGPFAWETISSGGQGPVNARLLWNAGITYGYGTDTSWHPRESLAVELRALSLMFSPKDIVSILTRNAAAAVLRPDRGTLEPGTLADLVILDGDPLANVSDLLKVAVVIKGGEVVAERR